MDVLDPCPRRGHGAKDLRRDLEHGKRVDRLVADELFFSLEQPRGVDEDVRARSLFPVWFARALAHVFPDGFDPPRDEAAADAKAQLAGLEVVVGGDVALELR